MTGIIIQPSWGGSYDPASVDITGGTLAGISLLTVSGNGAASTPPAKLTGTWFTGGSSTTTKPQYLIEPSGTTSTAWSTSGTGFGINAASGFAGNLLDTQIGGSRRFSITDSAGGTAVHSQWGASLNFQQFYTAVNGGGGGTDYLRVRSSGEVLINGGTLALGSGAGDVIVARDAANVWAHKNGTAAQTVRIYGTTTGSKYLNLTHDGTNAIISASSGSVHLTNIPTSNPGAGIMWYDSGTTSFKMGT